MRKENDDELIILSIGTAHQMAQEASDNSDYARLRAIWQKVVEDPEMVGDENDYHNYSVVLSRLDDYLTAYEIVNRGLQQFPYNTDLLADAINYGSKCHKYAEAQAHLATLNTRPYSSWTWRAFQFAIDFLQEAWNWRENKDEVEAGLNVALNIARRYQRYCPSDERSFLAEYEVLQNLAKVAMDKEQYDEAEEKQAAALKVLQDTIATGKYAAVQCSLRYADEMFRQQNYEEVIKTCDRALQYGQSTATARLGYFMYLSAQAREVLLYRQPNWRTNAEEVETIYREYLAAFADTGNDYIVNIRRRVQILSARSGIPPIDELKEKLKPNIPSELLHFLQSQAADS